MARTIQREYFIPTNVTPEYKKAEAAYRGAREPQERLELLREMLRTIPKHKGTEHRQADIKTKLKELTEELASPKKAGSRSGTPTSIRPDGAGQVVLLGPPNSGKSALHARLTGSHTNVGPYPFSTQFPQPGMCPVADIDIQLVDLPAVSSEHPVPWISNAVQQADGCLLVVDVNYPGCVAAVTDLIAVLSSRKIRLTGNWPRGVAQIADEDDPFAILLPTLVVGSKSELTGNATEELQILCDLTDLEVPTLAVSAETGQGLSELGWWLFDALGVVRVYTKLPGKTADSDRPYTVRRGNSVEDVAVLVHRDMASKLKYARLWSAGETGFRQVGRDYLLKDQDIIELHL